MLEHDTKIRVRYGETDQMGYMYYGNYPQFLEVARAELLRSLGWPYTRFESLGVMMPVTDLTIKYIKPARYDDEVRVKTILKKIPGIRIFLSYELYNDQDVLLTTAEITLVMIDMKTNRPCHAPDSFLDVLKPYFMGSN